jgi:hypothetical protein
LATLIPEPQTRGAPLPHSRPDVLVDIEAGPDPGGVVRAVHAMLRQGFADFRLRVPAPVTPPIDELYGPTLQSAPWDPDQLRRARARLHVASPLPPDALRRAMQLLVHDDLASVEILTSGSTAALLTSTRAAARAARWAGRPPPAHLTGEPFGRTRLEVGPAPAEGRELADFYAADWTTDA